ncbi:hypothetical protein GCM10022409_49330 [Hymenobacter glaciei]|uniref:Uncharacterized protein n=1 Tax=Hymenobacter glaciei TaxID=877209 RepID=A0ABP7UZE2_9BACT
MPAPPPILTEDLPIRRLGTVTQATATIWRDDTDPDAAGKPEGRQVPVTFPARIPLEGGWRLQHASPTSGKLVTENAFVDLFHSPKASNLRLNTFSLYNIGLLKSIATAFTSQPYVSLMYGALETVGGASLLPGDSPYLTYYRPLEAPEEQYLLLYQDNFAPRERPNEVPSYTNLYALEQVELDEERLIFLLLQALDAADVAGRYR